MLIFTVHDSKAEAFLQPFYADTRGLATRMFADAVNQTDHNFNRYAADYTLFCLGEFDQQTAGITLLPSPENLGLALQYREQPLFTTTETTPDGNT